MDKPEKRIKSVKSGDISKVIFSVENRHRKPPGEKKSDPEKLDPKVKPKQKLYGCAAKKILVEGHKGYTKAAHGSAAYAVKVSVGKKHVKSARKKKR